MKNKLGENRTPEEEFRAAFAACVANGPGTPTIRELSELSEISEDTLRHYRAGRSAPNFPALAALCRSLGPSFANRVLAIWGMGGAEWLEAGEVEPDLLLEQMTEATHAIAKATRMSRLKGHVCHVTAAAVRQALRPLAGIGAIVAGRRKLARAA